MISLYIIKLLQVSICNTNNSIQFIQIKSFKYFYLTLIILFNRTHSFANKNLTDSSKYSNVSLTIQLNICHFVTQLNDQAVLF